MQENWEKISHYLLNQYKGHGYKHSLLKCVSYVRTEMTDRSETRILLGVPSDLERQLVQKTIALDIKDEIQKLIASIFSIEFVITGVQTTFPAPLLDGESTISPSLTFLPERIETPKRVIEPSDFSLASTVLGNENTLLVKAIETVRNSPKDFPFPLLVTGPSGVGKSHHLKALWWELNQVHQGGRVKLITGEKFLTEFLEHIKTKQGWKFQRKYRNETDVLIIDDISCLKTAKKTQEELLAMLDYFQVNKKLIVISTPCSPSELTGLDPAIASRLTSGLHLQLDRPSVEFRKTFIEYHFNGLNLEVENDCQNAIANTATCFRTIMGYVNKIHFLFAGRKDLISTAEIAKYIQLDVRRTHKQTPEQVLQDASRKFNIDVRTIISKSRARDVVEARKYAIQLMRENLGMTLQDIGLHVGHRDHSTIKYALKKTGTESPKTVL